MTLVARWKPGGWTAPFGIALGVFLLADEASWWAYLLATHSELSLRYSLPLQLCEVGGVVTALALWLRRQLLVELAYFWGLSGSLIAVLTPDLPQHWPSFPYLQYYAGHGAAIAAAAFLVFGLGIRPAPWAPLRVLALTALLAGVIGAVDAATGGNYMYLRAKPAVGPTPLDLFGPWPWYLIPAVATAVLAVALLQLPFWLSRPPPPPRPAPPPARR